MFGFGKRAPAAGVAAPPEPDPVYPAFGSVETCVKCQSPRKITSTVLGNHEVTIRHVPFNAGYDPSGKGWHTLPPPPFRPRIVEHHAVTCWRCGYTWKERPADVRP